MSAHAPFLASLRAIVGRRHVLTGAHATKPYRTGYRAAAGPCLAVLRPGSLVDLWRVLKACVQADVAIIMQAANTGLTSGSTPAEGYDRPAVVINTRRLSAVRYIAPHEQVICLPGATLHGLERLLAPFGREPHSVIGSSCLGASVIGGVCNNSGGALVERGPAYTEMAVFARLGSDGALELVNRLGVDLGETPEEILARLDANDFDDADVAASDQLASDREYADWVRDVDAPTPARYNADPRRLKDAAGCAGKLAVFAVRLDTFQTPAAQKTYYIGTDDPGALTALRRGMLQNAATLPVSAEYIHRDIFTLTEAYGRDTVHLINTLGTARLPAFFAAKETLASRLATVPFLDADVIDRALQLFSRITPNPTPKAIRTIGRRYPHHLLLKVRDEGVAEAEAVLDRLASGGQIAVHACRPREAALAGLHRFAAAGAAIRYQTVRGAKAGPLLALDIALRRNDADWFETLPDEIAQHVDKALYYGHFFCHVLHQDYVLKPGVDAAHVKALMLAALDKRGAKYPAEHNVGHVYQAERYLRDHYRALDPTNTFNPGVGGESKRRCYAANPVDPAL